MDFSDKNLELNLLYILFEEIYGKGRRDGSDGIYMSIQHVMTQYINNVECEKKKYIISKLLLNVGYH